MYISDEVNSLERWGGFAVTAQTGWELEGYWEVTAEQIRVGRAQSDVEQSQVAAARARAAHWPALGLNLLQLVALVLLVAHLGHGLLKVQAKGRQVSRRGPPHARRGGNLQRRFTISSVPSSP